MVDAFHFYRVVLRVAIFGRPQVAVDKVLRAQLPLNVPHWCVPSSEIGSMYNLYYEVRVRTINSYPEIYICTHAVNRIVYMIITFSLAIE